VSAPSSSKHRLWRVLVIGNSMTTIVPGRTSRLEGPYSEVLEVLLRDAGINAEVRNAGREYELINRGIHRYQEEERAWSPDVLVVNYGMAEAQAPAIPKGVHNHFMTWEKGLSRPASAYRRRVAPKIWPRLRRYQRWAMNRMGVHFWRMSPRRFAAELQRVIALARADHRLVLVVDINPPGRRLLHNLPGIDQRQEILNGVLHDVVGKAATEDPDVKLIEASLLAGEMGMDVAIPDGYHWSPPAQRRVAEMLAAEIVPWIRNF
jgi:lysophospholipase L1-like esterase